MSEQIDEHVLRSSTRKRGHAGTLASVALLAGTVAVAVAACGGSEQLSRSSNSGPRAVSVADRYSACMRRHGVTSFPDPRIKSNGGHTTIAISVDPTTANSPAFGSAEKACAHLVPKQPAGTTAAAQQEAQTGALVAFARCMRHDGFASFPDPSTQGQPWTLAMLTTAGINLKEPAFRPAALTCTSVTHGILTTADVEHAIANPNELSQTAASP